MRKDIRRKFVPRKKMWKLHEDSEKSDFRSNVKKYRASSQKDAFDESYWKVLKEALREGTDKRCRWTKGPARHKEIWWWNDDVSNSVSEMRKLWKE